MIARAKSLRELRANRPANVEILPTAAPRQVVQKCNAAKRRAALELRKRHAHRFGYRHPHIREQIETAATLMEIEKTPALEIAYAILAALEPDHRERVACRLERQMRTTSNKQALAIAKSLSMSGGELVSLHAALDILQEGEGS